MGEYFWEGGEWMKAINIYLHESEQRNLLQLL
jgi:hypothetical protein